MNKFYSKPMEILNPFHIFKKCFSIYADISIMRMSTMISNISAE